MHLARDPKHFIVHMHNGFLNGMGWVINRFWKESLVEDTATLGPMAQTTLNNLLN